VFAFEHASSHKVSRPPQLVRQRTRRSARYDTFVVFSLNVQTATSHHNPVIPSAVEGPCVCFLSKLCIFTTRSLDSAARPASGRAAPLEMTRSW